MVVPPFHRFRAKTPGFTLGTILCSSSPSNPHHPRLRTSRLGQPGILRHFVIPLLTHQATFFSGLSPSAAIDVHRSLDKACQNLVVATDLHALYLVTPLDGLEPDWRRFREEYLGWREGDPSRVVGKAVRSFICTIGSCRVYLGLSPCGEGHVSLLCVTIKFARREYAYIRFLRMGSAYCVKVMMFCLEKLWR